MLADFCSLALHQFHSSSAEELIHSHREYHRHKALGHGSSNWAGAESHWFFKDNNVMTLLRHSNLALPDWALWTVLDQLWLCVCAVCGWEGLVSVYTQDLGVIIKSLNAHFSSLEKDSSLFIKILYYIIYARKIPACKHTHNPLSSLFCSP